MNDKKKQNCWEYHHCGREPGGKKVSELGLCPAAVDDSYSGINSGINGGRFCWAVAGTLCGGKVQGSFAEKRSSCITCDFFRMVREEEEGNTSKQSKFLKYTFSDQKKPFISGMSYKHVKSGERFITQGKVGEVAYIIQKGTCLVIVEKDGELHPVNHYGKGDIVGGVGLLTGEPRIAHVEAETDMELWVLNKEQFDNISEKDPDLLTFLTELVADRFDSKRPTAYRKIGKYLTTDIIGRGGYSIVYKGVHSALNLPVAVKMLRHNMAMDQDFLRGFYEEANTIACLDHENIVRIYDIEERYKTLFIIMELIEGEPLKDLLNHLKRIPPRLAITFLLQICSGLDYAHKRGIVHRDINPTNIMVKKRHDRLKIIDFGLTCAIGTEDYNSLGTLFYRAPEQIKGDPVGPHTDIYALGITAYEMATGRRPFPEENLWELRNIHLKEDIPDPAKIVPDIPEGLRRFILKAGRCDPSRRYQNVKQAMDDLHNLAEKYELLHKRLSLNRQKMTNLCLVYNEDRQLELNKLMEDFSARAQKIGVTLKVADFYDV
jgi:predicted Ser/Thr protein kinase